MEYDDRFSDSASPPPPRRRRRHSSICLTACFGATGDGDGDGSLDSPVGVGERSGASLLWSSSTWFRSKAHELPELRGKCRGFIPSHAAGKHHRRHYSSDFRYDPLSYALNFDEGSEGEYPAAAEDFRYRGFSSRLPASPSRAVGVPFDKAREGKGIKETKVMEAPM